MLNPSFLLFLIHSSPSFHSAAEAPETLHNTADEKIQVDYSYYILPAFPVADGSVMVSSTGNKTSPMDVVRADHELPSHSEFILQITDFILHNQSLN